MLKVTREQVREIMQMDLIWYHHDMPQDPPVLTVKDVTKMAGKASGEIAYIGMTGAKLYRYKDKAGSPAYCIMGYASDGSDVTRLLPVIGL